MKRKILPYNKNLKQIAKQLRKQMTLSEVLLWNHLKNYQMMGYDFDRQRPIDNYIVDFFCKDLMLAIEVDGFTHQLEGVAENDVVRQEKLESLGVNFLRFEDVSVKKDLTSVLDQIASWILEFGPQLDEDYEEKLNNAKRVY